MLTAYETACNYPGVIDEAAVELHLREYLAALGIKRNVVRIKRGWTLDEYPDLKAAVGDILDKFEKRGAIAAHDAIDAHDASVASVAFAARAAPAAHFARVAYDASIAEGARDASAALASLAARDAHAAFDAHATRTASAALHRFTEWCLYRSGWWWDWDLSWIATTYLGAKQNDNNKVMAWSRPIFDAFVSGGWLLFWTKKTLYWIAKPEIKVVDKHCPHCETGPALVCDIGDLYFWHGVLVSKHWIENRGNLDNG